MTEQVERTPEVTVQALGPGHADALVSFFAELPEGDRTFIREDVTDADVVRGWAAGSPGVHRWIAVDDDRVLGYVAVLRLPGWSDHPESRRTAT